jgi:hypothetical protein
LFANLCRINGSFGAACRPFGVAQRRSGTSPELSNRFRVGDTFVYTAMWDDTAPDLFGAPGTSRFRGLSHSVTVDGYEVSALERSLFFGSLFGAIADDEAVSFGGSRFDAAKPDGPFAGPDLNPVPGTGGSTVFSGWVLSGIDPDVLPSDLTLSGVRTDGEVSVSGFGDVTYKLSNIAFSTLPDGSTRFLATGDVTGTNNPSGLNGLERIAPGSPVALDLIFAPGTVDSNPSVGEAGYRISAGQFTLGNVVVDVEDLNQFLRIEPLSGGSNGNLRIVFEGATANGLAISAFEPELLSFALLSDDFATLLDLDSAVLSQEALDSTRSNQVTIDFFGGTKISGTADRLQVSTDLAAIPLPPSLAFLAFSLICLVAWRKPVRGRRVRLTAPYDAMKQARRLLRVKASQWLAMGPASRRRC